MEGRSGLPRVDRNFRRSGLSKIELKIYNRKSGDRVLQHHVSIGTDGPWRTLNSAIERCRHEQIEREREKQLEREGAALPG